MWIMDDYQYNGKSVWRRFWTEYSSHYGASLMLRTDIIFRLHGLLFPSFVKNLKKVSLFSLFLRIFWEFLKPFDSFRIFSAKKLRNNFAGNLEGARLSDGVTSIVAIDFG